MRWRVGGGSQSDVVKPGEEPIRTLHGAWQAKQLRSGSEVLRAGLLDRALSCLYAHPCFATMYFCVVCYRQALSVGMDSSRVFLRSLFGSCFLGPLQS